MQHVVVIGNETITIGSTVITDRIGRDAAARGARDVSTPSSSSCRPPTSFSGWSFNQPTKGGATAETGDGHQGGGHVAAMVHGAFGDLSLSRRECPIDIDDVINGKGTEPQNMERS